MISLNTRKWFFKTYDIHPKIFNELTVSWGYADQKMVGTFYFLNYVVRQYPRPMKSQFHGWGQSQ